MKLFCTHFLLKKGKGRHNGILESIDDYTFAFSTAGWIRLKGTKEQILTHTHTHTGNSEWAKKREIKDTHPDAH